MRHVFARNLGADKGLNRDLPAIVVVDLLNQFAGRVGERVETLGRQIKPQPDALARRGDDRVAADEQRQQAGNAESEVSAHRDSAVVVDPVAATDEDEVQIKSKDDQRQEIDQTAERKNPHREFANLLFEAEFPAQCSQSVTRPVDKARVVGQCLAGSESSDENRNRADGGSQHKRHRDGTGQSRGEHAQTDQRRTSQPVAEVRG